MARPDGGYRNAAGKRIPSVTTIIGHRKSSEGLIHWAWTEGMAQRDYRDTRDKAAGSGSIVHRMIEIFIAGGDPFTPDDLPVTDEAALRAFGAFCRWFDQSKVELVASEVSLVSEAHQFGGTLDTMLVIRANGFLAIGDWKTAKSGVRPDYAIQVSAYAALFNEHNPATPITGGGHIVRFDRESGDFNHVWLPMPILDLGFEAFMRLYSVYRTDQALEKAIKRGVVT